MKMNDIEVCVEDGKVLLFQYLDDVSRTIELTAEQAKMVGQWIKDVADIAAR